MKAFEGKSRSVQYKIATIINSGVAIDDTLNVYDIIQSICSDMATVGDVKTTVNQVNSVLEELKCDFCGYRHKTEDCRKLKQAKAQLAAGAISKLPDKAPRVFKGNCNKCGKKGHQAKDCDLNTVNTIADGSQPIVPAIPPWAAPAPAIGQPVLIAGRKFSPAEIQSLMSKIQSGEAVVSVAPRTKQTARKRKAGGKLPPRLIKKSAHASSLEAQGQPFGEYKGNRVLLATVLGCEQIVPVPVDPCHPFGTEASIPVQAPTPGSNTIAQPRRATVIPLSTQAAVIKTLSSACQLGANSATVTRKHPHASSLLVDGVQPFGEYRGNRVPQKIAISLCDGMGCALLALNTVLALLTRYIAVEDGETARLICDNVNDGAHGSTTTDRSFASSMFDITEDMIVGLGPGNIAHLCAGPPCQDHSKLRNIPRQGRPTGRPGLSGKKGRVFRQVMLIFMWVINHNPQCEFFIEFVDCSDMTEDWAEICGVLGQPISIVHDIVSFTRRNRMYWTNIPLPDDFGHDWRPLDPNTCMDDGRRVILYLAHGKECVYPLGASWAGPSDNPRSDTSRAVKVKDAEHDTPQDLRLHEASRLMGIAPGRTAGKGVPIKAQLTCLGNGWDMIVILKCYAFSRLARVNVISHTTPAAAPATVYLSDDDLKLQSALVALQQHSSDSLAQSLSMYERPQQMHMISLLRFHHAGTCALALDAKSSSIVDSGSSRHINASPVITDAEHSVSLTGFDSSQQWTHGIGYLPLEWRSREGDSWIAHDVHAVDAMQGISSIYCPWVS
jgi:hypothetical protein